MSYSYAQKVSSRDSLQLKKAVELSTLAGDNFEQGNYTEAIRLGTEVLKIRGKILGKNHPDYATSLSNLSWYLSGLGNDSEAVKLETEALEIRGKILGKKHPDYATSLSNLSWYISGLGNDSKAVKLETEALEIREKNLGKKHPDYATSLGNLANYTSKLGNNSRAIHLCTEALKIREMVIGKEHPDYAISISDLASYNYLKGYFLEAIRLGTEAVKIIEIIFGKEHPTYATALDNLALYNSSITNYLESIELGTEAMLIREKILGEKHPDYAMSLSNLSLYYSLNSNYSEAIRLGIKALKIREDVLGKNHPEYVQSMLNLASYYFYIGYFSEAIRLDTEASSIYKKIYGKIHPNYATSLSNLALYNVEIDNYNEALRLATNAIKIHKKVLGKHNPTTISCLGLIADINCLIGNYSKALRLGNKSLRMMGNKYGKNNPRYASILQSLSSYNYYIGNYTNAIQQRTEALEIYEKSVGKTNWDYVHCLNKLPIFYEKIQDITLFEHYWTSFIEYETNCIIESFQGLTAENRNSFWLKYQYDFEHRTPDYAYQYKTSSLIRSAYNGILFCKGLLLNTENEIKSIIRNSNDDSVQKLYDGIVENRRMLNKLLERPLNERFMNADSLRQIIDAQDRELLFRSKEYGKLKANMVIRIEDIQEKLGKNDLAIEFVSFNHGNDSIMYAALTLKKDYAVPKIIPLFEKKELDTINTSDYYTTDRLYNLLWEPLSEELQGVNNVYFAPSGILHNINIEALPLALGKNENRKYFRLSSTRELAYAYSEIDGVKNCATLYGGIRYDTKIEDKSSEKRSVLSRPLSNEQFYADFARDSIDLRGGWNYLPGTLVEVRSIDETIKNAGLESILYTAEKGTETSFKQIGAKSNKILHISTHGFYYNKRNWTSLRKKGMGLILDEQSSRYQEDKILTRSGLLFAGCSGALSGLPSTNENDGILYAYEIAQLDFRGVDLVTLSACETGLGEISGEGVFGLQRAFKKAGARSILMSLWKVDDEATNLLMNQFYRNYLIKRMSKSDALVKAQEYLRTFEVLELKANGKKESVRPYSDPEYWAAFVILDAIESETV